MYSSTGVDATRAVVSLARTSVCGVEVFTSCDSACTTSPTVAPRAHLHRELALARAVSQHRAQVPFHRTVDQAAAARRRHKRRPGGTGACNPTVSTLLPPVTERPPCRLACSPRSHRGSRSSVIDNSRPAASRSRPRRYLPVVPLTAIVNSASRQVADYRDWPAVARRDRIASNEPCRLLCAASVASDPQLIRSPTWHVPPGQVPPSGRW